MDKKNTTLLFKELPLLPRGTSDVRSIIFTAKDDPAIEEALDRADQKEQLLYSRDGGAAFHSNAGGYEPVFCLFDKKERTAYIYSESGKFKLVQNASDMFRDFPSLTSIQGLDRLDTSGCTEMARMFFGCTSLKNLDLSSWDVSGVSDMTDMFCRCGDLQSLDLSGWDTFSVEDMANMFNGCHSLKSLDLSAFNTQRVTDMTCMFSGCVMVDKLDLSHFDMCFCDADYMFYNCCCLEEIDFSEASFNQEMSALFMFEGCDSLRNVKLPEVRKQDEKIRSLVSSALKVAKQHQEAAMNDKQPTTLLSFNESGVAQAHITADPDTTKHLVFMRTDDDRVDKLLKKSGIRVWWEEPIKGREVLVYFRDRSDSSVYICSRSGEFKLPENAGFLFKDFKDLVSIEGLERLDVSGVQNMMGMFSGCKSLTELDLSSWNTKSVTDMSEMFADCRKLKSVDLSFWDTGSVTDMACMFLRCKSLEYLDVGSFDTSKVKSMLAMFCRCENLKELDLSGFEMSNTGLLANMFNGCLALSHLDLSNVTSFPGQVTDDMFKDCPSLSEVRLPKNPLQGTYIRKAATTALAKNKKEKAEIW